MTPKYYIFGTNHLTPLSPYSDKTIDKFFRGYGLESLNTFVGAEIIIAVDPKDDQLNFIKSGNFPKSVLKVLIIQEPKVVRPEIVSSKFCSIFDLTILIGRYESELGYTFNWPQFASKLVDEKEPSKRIASKSIMICSNKLSLIHGELYTFRRRLAFRLVQKVDVLGHAWNISFMKRVKIFFGTLAICLTAKKFPWPLSARYWFLSVAKSSIEVSDKRRILSNYRTSIVIENSVEVFTEKLFDAFFARVIPIYIGPDFSSYGIPSNLVIRARPNLASISSALKEASLLDYGFWRDELEKWLELESTKQSWDPDKIFRSICKLITKSHLDRNS